MRYKGGAWLTGTRETAEAAAKHSQVLASIERGRMAAQRPLYVADRCPPSQKANPALGRITGTGSDGLRALEFRVRETRCRQRSERQGLKSPGAARPRCRWQKPSCPRRAAEGREVNLSLPFASEGSGRPPAASRGAALVAGTRSCSRFALRGLRPWTPPLTPPDAKARKHYIGERSQLSKHKIWGVSRSAVDLLQGEARRCAERAGLQGRKS